jgi:hypothetical protein
LAIAGYAALVASLVLFVARSEQPTFSVLLAAPFGGVLTGRAVYLFFQVRARPRDWKEGRGGWNDEPYGPPPGGEGKPGNATV